MTAAELLSKLRSLKVRVRADNGRLFCDSPKGALTAELRAALNERKAEILALLDRDGAAARRQEPPLQRTPRDGDLPLSFSQQRLWFIDQLEPGSALYNVPKAFRIGGAADTASLEHSLNEIVRRHEVLRTTFLAVDGRPVQNISRSLTIPLPLVNLTDRPDSEREDEALRLINEEARRPFDLGRGPLLRALLLRLAAEDHILLLTLHHIVSDGWSTGILYRELSALYDAFCNGRPSPLGELPVQYVDFARWQREWLQGEVLHSQVTYWKERLASIPILQLPTDRPRPAVQSHRGARQSIVLADGLCEALKILSQKERASLFMTLLAAFNVLLYRYSGQEDIVVGTPIAGRNRVEIEPLIGFFVNTLVLRTNLSGDCTFRELLGRVRDAALDAYAHQDLPFEKLVEELEPERNLAHVPLSQVMFAFQNFPGSPLEMSGCSAQPLDVDTGTARFDLTHQISQEPSGMRCLLAYDSDLFDQGTTARMLGHFRTLLEGIVADPDRRVSELAILTEAERHQLLVEWNDTQREYPKDKCVQEFFEEQAERTPDAVAVIFEDQQLTYRELNRRANQLAHDLRKHGVGPEVLVGICVERSLEMIVGLLGILKAGGAYVPLDPEYPAERLEFLLDDARPAVLLTRRQLAERLPRHKATVVYVDADSEVFNQETVENPLGGAVADFTAYVIYTSGSTGKPKGVVVEHRQLSNYAVDIIRRLNIDRAYSFAMVQPLMFDSSVTMLFSSLLTGGSLHVVSRERAADPDALGEYFRRYPIDFLKITPSHLAALQASSPPERIMPRRRLVIGGEESRWEWVRSLQAITPECKIINHYGPTETTVGVLTCPIEDIEDGRHTLKTPLGRPIANTRVFLLDSRLEPVPLGIPGELYIGGDNLTRGYLNQAALTAERFVPDPFSTGPGRRLYKTGDLARYLLDGNIEFLGRVDHQVKIRGFRIEPGEIEAVLKQHPAVREAAVLAHEDAVGQKRLIGYVVPSQDRAPTIGGKPRYKLPNGAAVAQLNKNETDYLYQEIFERQAYLRHGITIKDGDCIFDVGANIGLFAVFANQIAKDPKVYSFEPNPAVFEILRANAALYGSDVKLFNCGLSDQAKTAEFTFFPGFSLLSGFYADAQMEKEVVKTFMINQEKAGVSEMAELLEHADAILEGRFSPETFTAELRTLSGIIEQEKIKAIDLLKINVEKSELDVLNGIKNADWRKIEQIVVEVDVKENLPAITSLLESQGFEFVIDQEILLAGTPLCYVYAVRPSQERALVREQPDGDHIRSIPVLDQTFLSAREIREFLGKKLPDPMVPSAYVLLDSLPLTPNGKIDRRALPEPDTVRPELQDRYVSPRSPTERLVAQIWSDVLQVDRIGIHDNFFDLGGHSLLATQLISRIRDAFRIELPLRSLFEAPTLAGLAERIISAREGKAMTTVSPILPEVLDEGYPLSFSQERFWFLSQLEPENLAYSVAYRFRITGPLNTEALERSLAEIVRRHETLRTTIQLGEGKPVQVVSERWSFRLDHLELSEETAADLDTKVQSLFKSERRRSFDLSADLLLRGALLRLKTDEHVLLLNSHHIAWDHWCIELFFHELATLYRAYSAGKPSPLPDLPIQYKHYALWQRETFRGAELKRRLSYWKQRLNGAPPSLNLPTDHARMPLDNRRGGRQSVLLSNSLADDLQTLSRKAGVTLFMTFLAAFQTLLHRLTNETDIVVGTPVAGRDRSETEGLIGLFLNSLALRTDLSGNPTFRELLTRVRDVALGAYDHRDLPFEKLVEELQPERDLTQTPVFQVFINMYNFKEAGLELDRLSVEPIKTFNPAPQFDLDFYIREHVDGTHLIFVYDSDLFDAATIARILGQFQVLLQGVVSNSEQRISDLLILTDAERQQLLTEWNDTKRDYPEDKCLHQLFEEQAARTPDAIAVVFEDRQLTYRELNRRSNQLAHFLMKQGVGPETFVGLYVEPSLEMLAGILGILKAGAAYVPLDPAYPDERIAFMMEDACIPVLLTQQGLLECLPRHNARVVILDADWQTIAREDDRNPVGMATEENIAYVIYTSGSTGQPKGVMIPHRAICNHMFWMQTEFPLTEIDRVVQRTPFSFDASVWEFFAPLLAGARLVVARDRVRHDSEYLTTLITEQEITVLQVVPSLLQMFLEGKLERCRSLRRVFCGGEALPVELCQRFQARTAASLCNLYGPTEACIDASFWRFPLDRVPRKPVAPIGRPIANTQMYIIVSRVQPVPVGVPGELCIGGLGLARGYLNRPELTAEKFIPNPFSDRPGERLYRTGDLARYLSDGNIEFLGRIDHQVKVRGYRIELGEIEAVLRGHPQVSEAVVLAREDAPGDKRLVGYVVNREPVQIGDLRNFLNRKLPDYMVPSVFVFMDSLPLTPSGKIDRRALPPPDQSRPELESAFAAPPTPVEDLLAKTWAEVLKLEKVGIHDNFFDLGGHSLLATQVVSRLRDAFRVDLPLRSLFESPTVAALAERIETLLWVGEKQQPARGAESEEREEIKL